MSASYTKTTTDIKNLYNYINNNNRIHIGLLSHKHTLVYVYMHADIFT